MSGIAGVVGVEPFEARARAAVEAMCGQMMPRGPDDGCDQRNQRLLLAGERLGIKPLYYARLGRSSLRVAEKGYARVRVRSGAAVARRACHLPPPRYR